MAQLQFISSTYMAGSLTAAVIDRAFTTLRHEREVIVGMWPDDPRLELLPSDPYYEGVAIDFTDRTAAGDLSRFLKLPAGCLLRAVDHDLFRRLEGHEWYVSIFGSTEKAFENGLGYCLVQGDTIVCEAFAGPHAGGIIEIGIGTHEAHRGQGYATIVAAHLIRACEEQGYQTYWNTAQQNNASIALARKLGYRTEKPYQVWAWRQYSGGS